MAQYKSGIIVMLKKTIHASFQTLHDFKMYNAWYLLQNVSQWGWCVLGDEKCLLDEALQKNTKVVI